jgi:phage shock protein PspC (stress-responsive transcriptional regulator)
MTTTQPSLPPAAAPVRRLRRSRTDRIGAGVAGGLGDYFGVDPVLFRVLFATAAFFGGAGILGYLLAWAAIPEEGTERAAIDGWVAGLRRRRIPIWLVAGVAALVCWLAAFSWWAPGPFFPVVVVVIILVMAFARHGRGVDAGPPDAAMNGGATDGGARNGGATGADAVGAGAPVGPVSLAKPGTGADQGRAPEWVSETRQWINESREARRRRLRRSFPIRIATLGTLAAALLTLGLIDGVSGIPLVTYFWFTLAIVGAGVFVGLATRRTPWGVATLLVPATVGAIAFGGSHVGFGDGIGQSQWRPVTAPASSYRLAFGQGVLDLRGLRPQSGPTNVRVDVGAGQVKILAPKSMKLTVLAHVHFGDVRVDGRYFNDHGTNGGGVNLRRTIVAPKAATGQPVVVTVHLADGELDVHHV